MSDQFRKNPALPDIIPAWEGNPMPDGKFQNLGQPFEPDFKKILKWQFSRNPQRTEKKNDKWRPEVKPLENLPKEDCIIWLGHASFFIRIDGINILIDPVFYKVSLVKREVGRAIKPTAIHGLDYILISHGHMDHLDKRSLKEVAGANPEALLLTALDLGTLINQWLPGQKIQEAGWYQEYHLPQGGPRIFFLPAYHWFRRSLSDTNKTLWGSFIIEGRNKTIYFGADSAYKPHFSQIGSLFPNIDYALLGIGAYKPDYVMENVHTSPAQAVQAFHDLKAKNLIPMHYGTYDLSDEPMGEPYREMKRMEREGLIHGKLHLPAIGEVKELKTKS